MELYGLNGAERQTNLHKYNRPLFDNMKYFMDACWEINLITNTAVMIYNVLFQEYEGQEFAYEEMLKGYGDGRVYYQDRKIWFQQLGEQSLKELKKEKQIEIHLLGNSGIPEMYRLNLTPALDEEGNVQTVYLSFKNIEKDIMLQNRLEEEKNAMLSAMSTTYSYILYCNLSKNKCDAYGNESYKIELPHHSAYDDVFRILAGYIRKENLLEFYNKFDRYSLLKKLTIIGSGVEMEVQQTYNEEEHWTKFKAIRVQGTGTEDVIAVIFTEVIDARKENERREKYELEKSNEKLRRTLSMEEQYRRATVLDNILVYNVNVSANVIEEDIYGEMEGRQYDSVLRWMGLAAPCSFDLFIRRCAERAIPVEDREGYLRAFNSGNLQKCYEEGNTEIIHEYRVDIGGDEYMSVRKTVLLAKDEISGDVLGRCSIKDITEEKAREQKTMEALRESLKAVEVANQTKSSFLSRMSHDIRTPLNVIMGMTTIAGTHLDDKEKLAECLRKINVSGKHLLTLVNEVLDICKIETGRIEFSREFFNLSELLENLVVMARQEAGKKRHTLDAQIEKLEHELVIGDSLRIQQMFMNIVDNAISYTPDGGLIKINISEKASHSPKVGCYELIIEDNGIGMSEEFIEHLYEPFARAEDTRINKVRGNGLGMPIVRNIVSMMDGDIQVESALSVGTKFTVTINLTLQEEVGNLEEEFRGFRVLVADDMRESCESICIMLQEMGIAAKWVQTGKEAIEEVAEAQKAGEGYFAVMLDWKMPDMDGISTAREIRRRVGEEPAIIAFSAYDWSDIEMAARAAGINYFLSKPFFKSKIAYLFRTILEESKDSLSIQRILDKTQGSRLKGKRILLVEDNELNMEIVVEILHMLDIETDCAGHGKEAVEKFSEKEPGYYDMILMDVQMPVMNGYEATRFIRAMKREDAAKIPVIAMTANAYAEDIRAARDAGMNEHMAKPLELPKLMDVLNRWIPETAGN